MSRSCREFYSRWGKGEDYSSMRMKVLFIGRKSVSLVKLVTTETNEVVNVNKITRRKIHLKLLQIIKLFLLFKIEFIGNNTQSTKPLSTNKFKRLS